MKEELEKFILKWENDKDMWRRTLEDPLMYTKEDRVKAANYVTILCAVLADVKKLLQ